MEERFSRTALLLGENGVERLKNSRVAVFGVGGVGSFTVEALARLGIGHITLVDPDKVAESNLNRQLVALHSTLGMYKVDAARARILDINPEAEVEVLKMFYLPENADCFDVSRFDCIVDAIDTVSAKIELIVRAKKAGVHIVSSMGTGNKLHPEMLEIADISKTSVCPLARVMRRELRARRGLFQGRGDKAVRRYSAGKRKKDGGKRFFCAERGRDIACRQGLQAYFE